VGADWRSFVCGKCRKPIAGSFVDKAGAPWHKECADEGRRLESCHGCGKPLAGKVIRALDNPYHLGCFACHKCKAAIDGPFVTNEGRPFHKHCAPSGGAAPGGMGASKGPCTGCSKDVRVGEPVRKSGCVVWLFC
jgi:hypothetical protein